MISFFPTPYPDELWYSVICRYHVHSGNYCAKHTLRQLYGDNFCAPSLMLCGPINTLLAQLPQGFLSAKDVVMQHTFYPYYARFFPTQRKRSTYAYLRVADAACYFVFKVQKRSQYKRCLHYPRRDNVAIFVLAP